jgi:F-type H+-transporting ATPase subunit epsilon
MADKVAFELVSPERLLLAADCEMVVVPGSEGDFGVLAGHVPMISAVRPGVIEVHEEGAVTNRVFISGGLAEVTDDRLTVLAEDAVPVGDLDAADLDQRIKDAGEDLEDANTDAARHKHEATIALLSEMRQAVK